MFEKIYLYYENILRKIGKYFILLALLRFWEIIKKNVEEIFGNVEKKRRIMEDL